MVCKLEVGGSEGVFTFKFESRHQIRFMIFSARVLFLPVYYLQYQTALTCALVLLRPRHLSLMAAVCPGATIHLARRCAQTLKTLLSRPTSSYLVACHTREDEVIEYLYRLSVLNEAPGILTVSSLLKVQLSCCQLAQPFVNKPKTIHNHVQ